MSRKGFDMHACTCWSHTDAVGREISDNDLRILIRLETCYIERRALLRILANREASLR